MAEEPVCSELVSGRKSLICWEDTGKIQSQRGPADPCPIRSDSSRLHANGCSHRRFSRHRCRKKTPFRSSTVRSWGRLRAILRRSKIATVADAAPAGSGVRADSEHADAHCRGTRSSGRRRPPTSRDADGFVAPRRRRSTRRRQAALPLQSPRTQDPAVRYRSTDQARPSASRQAADVRSQLFHRHAADPRSM